jgi:hypothetical protein
MRQLMIDIKADELFESGDEISRASLLKIDGSLRAGQLLTHPLHKILGFIDNPLAEVAPSLHEGVRARMRVLLRGAPCPGVPAAR